MFQQPSKIERDPNRFADAREDQGSARGGDPAGRGLNDLQPGARDVVHEREIEDEPGRGALHEPADRGGKLRGRALADPPGERQDRDAVRPLLGDFERPPEASLRRLATRRPGTQAVVSYLRKCPRSLTKSYGGRQAGTISSAP